MEAKSVILAAHRSALTVGVTLALLTVPLARRAVAQGVTATPMIQLRVVDEQGAPIDAGRAVIDSLNRWVLIERGGATLTDLPRGRWTVALRVLGFRPESVTLDAAIRPDSVPTVRMHRIAQALAAVEVTAPLTSKDSARLRDVERRLRTAHGTLILSDNLAVRNASDAIDALSAATGFSVRSATVVRARGRCESVAKMDTIMRRGTKVVAIYLDGNRVPGGLEMLNRTIPPSDILAIEAYPDVTSAPFLWRTNDACAVVAYWTRKPPAVVIR
jgi:hypothetical protein